MELKRTFAVAQEIILVILYFMVPSRFSHEKYLCNVFVGIYLPLILKI
jgi:hypothetical protein